MSSSKKILNGFFWGTTASLLNALYGFFSVPLLLVHFGQKEYSLITVAFSVNVYLRLMDMGFANGNIKFFSQWIIKGKLTRVNKLFQSNIVFYTIVGILNALVLFIVSCFSHRLFTDLTPNEVVVLNKMLYVLMASAFLGWVSALFDQFLKANEIIGWEQRLMVFIKVFQVFILILTLKYDYSLLTYFLTTSLSSLLIIPFTIRKIRKLDYKVSFIPKYYHEVFRQVMPYSLSVFSVSIFQFSANYLRPVLLGIRGSVLSVTDYSIMNGFINLIGVLSISFVGLMLPAATRAVAMGNTDQKHKIAYDATKYITIFLAVIIFGFVLIAKELILVYVGPGYLYLMPWLYTWALTVLLSHTSGLSSLVYAENKMMPVVYISAFSAITSLTLEWLLAPYIKVGGAVLGWLYYCTSQTAFFYIWYYPKILKLNSWRILFRSFLHPTVLVCLCAVATYFIFKDVQISSTQIMGFNLKGIYLKSFVIGLSFVILSVPVIYFLILNRSDKSFMKRIMPFGKG
ncbi:MAG: lipopolysaccharide biosynthesis protein [Sphingobacteriaceae bacterium]|nr:MAG: lipopolysaccharide biosynthesis protein [Sphingobacteriaceae bacterium]